jgi:cytochrome P450
MADIYGRLVRLRDDAAGATLKTALERAVQSLDLAEAAQTASGHARTLGERIKPEIGNAELAHFIFAVPLAATASLLGAPEETHAQLAAALGDYGRASAAVATGYPEPTETLIGAGHAAARTLLSLVGELITRPTHTPLMEAWLREARASGCEEADIVANAVGVLVQAYAATGALIGLVLLALARRPDLRRVVEHDRTRLRPFVAEVLRQDPVTHSTPRFVAMDGIVAGQHLREGQMIVVMLAAANHDGTLNPDPQAFEIDRPTRRALDFGAGRHACPGNRLAPLITEIAVEVLLKRHVALDTLEAGLTYAASAHIRTPVFKS